MKPAYSLRRLASSVSGVLLHQHFGEADDGVERRAQFVTHGGKEAALGGVGALRLGMRASQAPAPADLRSVTSRMTATTSRRSSPPSIADRLLQRAAAHLDPNKFRHGAAVRHRRRRAARGIRPSALRQGPRRRRARSDRPAGRRHGRGRTGHGRAIAASARRTMVSAAGETNSTAPSRPCRVMTSVMLRASSR